MRHSTPASRIFACSLIAFGVTHAADTPPPSDPAKPSTLTLTAVIQPDATKPAKTPAFHEARLSQDTHITAGGILHYGRLTASILQGEPEVIAVEIAGGEAEIVKVDGVAVAEWSVRRSADGRRFLDLRPTEAARKQKQIEAAWVARSPDRAADTGKFAPPLFLPGNASAGELTLAVTARDGRFVAVESASGLLPVRTDEPEKLVFVTRREHPPALTLRTGDAASAADAVALENFSLVGDAGDDAVTFTLRAEAVVREAGAGIPILRGDAALSGLPSGARIAVRETAGEPVVWLVFDLPGRHAVSLDFAAAIRANEGRNTLRFAIPGARVAPYSLRGFAAETRFDAGATTSPLRDGSAFAGFLPPGGDLALAWKVRREEARAKCFFTTDELSDLRVGDGLAAQTVTLTHRVLQGECDKLAFDLVGDGEVMAVRGDDIRSWQVVPGDAGKRRLEVDLARPRDGEFALTVDTRTALGAMPASFAPVRVVPVGAVRHGGLARIAGKGAVRLAVSPSGALTQVNPNRFPGAAPDAAAFAYRVSAPEAAFRVQAEDILPEVAVTQTVIHRAGDTETAIEADLELEIREAPLRDFTVRVPAGYIASSVTAADLAEYRLLDRADSANDPRRPLLLTFAKPVSGKQLIRLRLERAGATAPGALELSAFEFPGVKSVRGFLGVAAAPGLRLAPAKSENLAEVATAFFPVKTPGIQHAFRIRDARWSASLTVERLAQAVQSDMLHQYLVRDGGIVAGTVANYVIVGAPVASLRFAVPGAARNLEFTGGDIRSWKRDGDTVEVTLNRPVLGAFTLLATFELPLDARGGETDLSGVRPLGVQSEVGHVLVTAERPFAVSARAVPKNHTVIEPAEIPSEYRLLADAPLLAAYQYAGADTGLRLDLRPRDTGDAVARVVDFTELKTKLGADGQTVTEMRCLVKSRERADLRVTLPAGARLWTVTVDDKEVLPARAGDTAVSIPLPGKNDPNAVSAISLRLAGPAPASPAEVRLIAPVLDAPVLQTAWTVEPDEGRRLLASGGNLAPAAPDDRRSPRRREEGAVALGAAFLTGAAGLVSARIAAARRARDGVSGGAFLTFGGLAFAASVFAALVAADALTSNFDGEGALRFSATFLEPGRAPELIIRQHKPGAPVWDVTTLTLTAGALGCLVRGVALRGRRGATLWRAAGWGAAVGAAMSMPSGYAGAALLAAAFTATELMPGAWRTWRRAGDAASGVAALLAAGVLITASPRAEAREAAQAIAPGGCLPPPVPPVRPAPPAEAVSQTLRLEGDRWRGSGEIRVSGVAGDSFELLRAPAALTGVTTPDGVRLTRTTVAGATTFRLTLDRPGAYAVKFTYDLPVTGEAGEIALPTGRAAADSVRLEAADAPRTVGARGALSRKPDGSALTAVFPMGGDRTLLWGPKTRDVRAESLVFYAETADLFTLSPGLIEGRHRVQVKPSRGLVSELILDIPKNFAVSGVTGDGVGDWRFDPESQKLRVTIVSRPVQAPGGAGTVPSASQPFTLTVDTQAATGALPARVPLGPVAVRGAAGATGLLALASGGEVAVSATPDRGLATVNPDDFPSDLAGERRQGDEAPVVRRAFRLGADGGSLAVDIAAVEAELRVESDATVSVGEDRTVLTEALAVSIRRSGVFSLRAELPAGYDVESITGDALSHWSESTENGRRFVTLHLRGRTLGDRRFHVTLAGPGVAGVKRWTVPSFAPLGVARRTGKLTVVPEEGLRLHAADRTGVTQTEAGRTARKGALAFGLHRPDWKLAFEVENAAPWVRCEWLQDLTLADGRVRAVTRFDYTVENAAVKSVRIRIPATAEGVRVTGDLVSDASPVSGEAGLWEVKLRRRTLGKLAFEAAYRLPGGEPGKTFTAEACSPADAAVRNGWLAIRTAGRLVASPEGGRLPDTLRPADRAALPASLRRDDAGAPLLLRAVDAAYALPLSLAATDPAKLLPVRVTRCELDTTLGDGGAGLTRVRLELSLTDKRPVRFTPPAGAKLWHAFVNDRTVRPAVEGADFLVPAEPNPDPAKPATLEIWYAANGLAPLPAPKFDLPLENITWSVRLPEGSELSRWRGDFRESGRDDSGLFGVASSAGLYSDRQQLNDTRAREQAKSAESLLKLGNEYKSRGDQEGALRALNLARSLSGADAALNEDARVQYNNLRLEQIEYGLNRRRNANMADNGLAQAPAVPQAQTLNFTAEEADRLRAQNAAEDNAALRKLAERFVALQQGATGAPEGIRTVAPGDGRRIAFTKALQTGANADLRLELDLRTPGAFAPVWRIIAALGAAGAAALALLLVRRKS